MASGHLQQKKGNWYIVLNLHDETGKRAPKWIATHLPVQGNKRRAEEMLLQARQQYTDIYGKPGPSGAGLYAAMALQDERQGSPTTYRNYKYVIENNICPYFGSREFFVAEIAGRPQKQKYLLPHYSAGEVNQLLDKLRGHWMYTPVVLSVFYGLRRSEVLRLQWGSVDSENETITIQHTRIHGDSDGTDDVIERDILKR